MSAPLTGPLMCALRARHRLLGTTRLRPPITTTRCQTARFSTAANDTPHLSPSPSSLPSQPPPTPLPATTLAATYSQTGDPSTVLTTTRLPLPTALPPGSLLLRFLAAPINPSDLNMVEGSYPLRPPSLPATAGNEGVAVIAALGAEAARRGWRAGQWVTPLRPCMGTWRQYAVVDSATVEAVPPGLTVHQAAQLSVNPCTAYRLLTDVVALQRGGVVVQNAATSAVGLSVIQMARERGLVTVNLIRARPTPQRTRDTVERLRELGATHVVVEDEAAVGEALAALPAAELALNGVGGGSSTALFRALRKANGARSGGGVHVTYGGMSRRPVVIGAGQLIFGGVDVRGFWMSRWNEAHEGSEERRRMREEIAQWMREGKLKLDVEEVKIEREGVEEIRHALQRNAESFRLKKVLLTFASSTVT